ncbi:MAG: xanthine dehydrogenase family protein molybdopterin-binding subunit [Chloroflexi bacterium]|nr:xanthine dehydrogenase family protein molybdopterin-binding subunit [Chloroflexota bacterium]
MTTPVKTPPERQIQGTRVVGSRPSRVDAWEKVVGKAIFGPDVSLPRMAHAKILRSPHAHARIVRLDTRRAEALDGVYAVATADDLPQAADRTERVGEGNVNYKYMRDNTFASDKVLYQGHPIVAVAARTPQIAEQALGLIDVEYELLEPVLDVRRAMAEDAPILHEEMRTRSLAGIGECPSNIASHFQFLKGDPDRAFAEADVVVERIFETTTVHQGYLEPHAAVAVWDAGGTLTIYTTTQGAFDIRNQVHELLHHPLAKIVVVPTEVGGAFGGKNLGYVEVPAAILARKAGRPVKLVMTTAEVLSATGPSSGAWIRAKMGATRDGRIVAAEAELCYEAGAYPGSSVGSGANCIWAGYEIPNGRIDGYDVVVNKPRIGSYRAPGATPSTFAGEAVVDELAEKLGLDPIEFRLRNVVRHGSERLNGAKFEHIAAREVLEAVRDHPHYRASLERGEGSLRRGRGVAMGYWGNWGGRSSVTLSVNDDGTVSLIMGSVDITGTRTSIAMQAAEALGLDLAQIRPAMGDTQSTGYSDTSGGSRTTIATGTAAVVAARDVIAQMRQRAAILWDTEVDQVRYEAGVFTHARDGATMTFAEVAGQLGATGGAVRGKGDVDVRRWGGAFGAHIADVEVDIETGRVRLLRYTAVQDVGRAIHPGQVEGQMQGGAAQGIGWALYEGYAYDEQGHLLNPNFLDYKMPTMLDIPPIETLILEIPYPEHPYGVRGVGENPIVPPPAAIANAIYRATGARQTRLPMTPARILESMGVI